MDVEQAMQLVDGTADVRDFALWVEAANTLAAEVRRLQGVVDDYGQQIRERRLQDEASAAAEVKA